MDRKRFGSKQMCEIVAAKGRRMMVSYQTPVVIVDSDNYFITEEWFSPTTTKHINYYLKLEQAIKIHKVDPRIFKKMISGEI
jgi:hypothetical protein